MGRFGWFRLGFVLFFFLNIQNIYKYIYIYTAGKIPKIILTQINICFVEEYCFRKNSLLNKRSSPKENKV
jgi:hypothetical protein